MNLIAVFLAIVAAARAAAQAPDAPAIIAPAEAVEPARLEAARATVDKLWPLGTYERTMRRSMDQLSDAVLASMADMKMGDLLPGAGGSERLGADKTLRETMSQSDPHFLERARITNRVMVEEMIPTLARIEPAVREALARAYARRFTAAQLADMTRFFSTPSGSAFAREWMTVMTDKEMSAATKGAAPEMVKAMPRIVEKVKAATAHLPPPRLTPPPPPPGKKR